MNDACYAVIDLGTNTCLLLVAQYECVKGTCSSWIQPTRAIHTIHDEAQVVRLGQGVDQARQLQPEAMARTLDCLKKYALQVKKWGLSPKDVICVTTSSARDAKNSTAFFEEVRIQTGLSFRVLSGVEEAELTFQGALLPGMKPDQSFVLDIGGGSTELVSLQARWSMDCGAVRVTERFFASDPVSDSEFWAAQEFIDRCLGDYLKASALKDVPPVAALTSWVAVAGTATTLATWYLGLQAFDASQIQGLVLTRGDVHRQVEELKWRTIQEKKALPGVEPQRADVLLAGALILWRCMELLQFKECCVSTQGLRYGVLLSQMASQ